MNTARAASLTIFLLFFGVSTLEAFQTHNFIKAAFWLAIGIAFLVAGNLKPFAPNSRKS